MIQLLDEIAPKQAPSVNLVLNCSSCPVFPKPSPLPIATGVVLIVGLIISYFFQYLSFYKNQSSKGVSSFSIGLALLSSLLTFINFLILHWTTVVCCSCVNLGPCIAANLTPLQLFVNVLCLLFIYSCFLWYFPLEPYSIFRLQRAREYTRAQVTLAVVLVISVIFAGTSATLYYGVKLAPKVLHTFGRVIGIFSALVVIVQWTPQIFTTFRLGSAGSLSIVMLVMQMPGALLTVFFQAILGGADVTTWGPYLITAINTMILIIMCVVFWIRNRNGTTDDNMDLLLSEDEHHVYEYDQDADALSRKSYGSLLHVPPVSSMIQGTPSSAKLAWSLSDRNGFKGNLSAATFITSGTSKRTRAHLSGKDLLGTSKGFGDESDGVFDTGDMFSRSHLDEASLDTKQPPLGNMNLKYPSAASSYASSSMGPPPSIPIPTFEVVPEEADEHTDSDINDISFADLIGTPQDTAQISLDDSLGRL